MVNSKSVVGIQASDSSLVIGDQADEFTLTWLKECLVAWLCIHAVFKGKMSTLTHFPLEPWCDDYSFWTKHLQTLSMVLILHNFKDTVPPSEACYYGHINWSLAQTQQQSMACPSLQPL